MTTMLINGGQNLKTHKNYIFYNILEKRICRICENKVEDEIKNILFLNPKSMK